MWKFARLHEQLTAFGLITPANLHTPTSPPHAWFTAVHDADYYSDFMNGELGAPRERRIGFNEETRLPALIERTRLECAGTVLTVQLALQHGVCANLGGGTHHAHRDFGSGFTILNDLAVGARWAIEHAGVQRVAVIDLDVHQGDGTASIFAEDPRVFTCSMHCGKNFPFRKSESDLDVDVPPHTRDHEYMAMLRPTIKHILSTFKPELVLYDAGVDVWEGDQLGHLSLTHAGIWHRDWFVVDSCLRAGIPIACVIGGGYDRDAIALARRHAMVHRVVAVAWERHALHTKESNL